MKEVSLKVATLDDLRELKFRISQMDKGHQKFAGHDWAKCAKCNEIAELRAGVFAYKRQRTAWLARERMRDRKEYYRLEKKINNHKYRRGTKNV